VTDALIVFAFDPILRIGDSAVRWETIGIAIAIFAAIVLAGVIALGRGMRVDDLLFVVLGIVPGAVIGGRVGYVLLYPSMVSGDFRRFVDPGLGGLELTLGVVGGLITGTLTAAVLDGKQGRWLHVAALPMLIALGIGKLAMVLGGSGQGQATNVDPATAYLGPGPWGSLGPAVPSIPSQALEGVATLLLAVGMLVLLLVPVVRRADGRALFIALGGWAAIRFVVASTWRDPVTIGPLRTEQVIDLVVLIAAAIAVAVLVARRRGVETVAITADPPAPDRARA
jgi:prolipoprotein diacylglyceryltransferase